MRRGPLSVSIQVPISESDLLPESDLWDEEILPTGGKPSLLFSSPIEDVTDGESIPAGSDEEEEFDFTTDAELADIVSDLPRMLLEASQGSPTENNDEGTGDGTAASLEQYLKSRVTFKKDSNSANGYSDTPDILYDRIARWAQILLGAEVNTTALKELVQAAFVAADNSYGSAVAAAWGERNFPGGIPDQIVREHMDLLKAADGDFSEMARRRLESIHGDRRNSEKVATLAPDNPEIKRLLALSEGMEVFLDPEFHPNGASAATRPKLRKKYIETANSRNTLQSGALD